MIKAAELLVKCLEAQGVQYVFGIPGAKIDAVFDALQDSSIKLILCRHEQNAAFMAAMYGRLTEKPGVVLVTSGPGVTNLTTGLLTATTECDPIVALGGAVPQTMRLKRVHQNADNVGILKPVTIYSAEIADPQNIPEVIADAFSQAVTGRRGAVFLSLPQDVLGKTVNLSPIVSMPVDCGVASDDALLQAVKLIQQAKHPLLLLGEAASRGNNAKAIRTLLKKSPVAVACTFEAAGIIPRELEAYFVGRLGVFQNQPGDAVLSKADLVIAVGFNPAEYDPELWNKACDKTIIGISYRAESIRQQYHPALCLLGDIGNTIEKLSALIPANGIACDKSSLTQVRKGLLEEIAQGSHHNGERVHPLRFIVELQKLVTEETTILCDIGSVYMWMARYFFVYRPHHLLFSNGQQTLGVGLPWAMATTLARPGKPVVSLSGDGGFLFSAMELETAVRCKMNFVHFVWTDGTYNMVLEQEVMKYHRKSGVDFGRVDIPLFAQAFGATGFSVNHSNQLVDVLKQAFAVKQGPVLVNIPIDYSDNPKLFASINPQQGN